MLTYETAVSFSKKLMDVNFVNDSWLKRLFVNFYSSGIFCKQIIVKQSNFLVFIVEEVFANGL